MEEKQLPGKQRREGPMNQHHKRGLQSGLKDLHAQPKPSRTQGEALPQPLETTEGSVLLPRPQGKGA